MRYGRHIRLGRKYGTSWEKADAVGSFSTVIMWILIPPTIVGALLFFLTGLPKIGIPLWVGTTLGIAGLVIFFMTSLWAMGLAHYEVQKAFEQKLEDESEEERDEL